MAKAEQPETINVQPTVAGNAQILRIIANHRGRTTVAEHRATMHAVIDITRYLMSSEDGRKEITRLLSELSETK